MQTGQYGNHTALWSTHRGSACFLDWWGGPHRCVSTLTTNGQVGAAIPQNLTEMAFTSVLMVLTVTIFNYVLGEITNVIMAQDAALWSPRARRHEP